MRIHRYKWSVDAEAPLGRTIDLAPHLAVADCKAASIAHVRELQRQKVAAIHAALNDPERMLLAMVRYMRLVRKGTAMALTGGEAAWLSSVDALLGRAWAIRQAADDIEAEISAKTTSAEVLDHHAALDANPLWPE